MKFGFSLSNTQGIDAKRGIITDEAIKVRYHADMLSMITEGT